MPRKRDDTSGDGGGAPAWMVTYGDMMTLLLCFFVMLVSLSEIKTEKFLKVLQSLRRAFGYSLQRAPTPSGDTVGNSMLDRMSYYEFIRGRHNWQGQSDQRGAEGPHGRVTMVREGTRTVVGGRVGFARNSADLSETAKEGLEAIVELLRGHPNKVEVRGHASRQPLARRSTYADKWDLAYARARTVARFVTDRGIDPERVRIVSCGDREPLKETYQTAERWRNRRVEVVMMEATPDEFRRPAGPPAR